jgi:protein-tyrosine phosphatase
LHINQNKSTSLLVDIQAHIIPGLNHDNGPASYDEALNLIIALKDAGYKKIITTPRLSNQIIAQDTKVILHTLDKLRNTLKEKEVDIVIEAAACYELDDLFLRALEQKKVSTFNKNYIFIEGPDHLNYEALKEYIIKIDHAGYKTVLAHPEKYAFIHGDLSNYQELKRLKVLLALDINSLSITNPDDKIKHCSDMLIEHKMIDLIGSHARTAEDVHTIQTIQSSERYKKLLNSNIILNNYLY